MGKVHARQMTPLLPKPDIPHHPLTSSMAKWVSSGPYPRNALLYLSCDSAVWGKGRGGAVAGGQQAVTTP